MCVCVCVCVYSGHVVISDPHRVLKSQRSKMSIIYMQS